MGSESEPRAKDPAAVNILEKCAIVQKKYFVVVYGKDHMLGRLEAIRTFARIHEDRPEVPPFEFIVDVWRRMR